MPTARIGLPIYDSAPAITVASLWALAEARVGPMHMVRGTWIDKARNELMTAFEKEDYLLMVDADMVFTNQDVGRLLEAIRKHPECGAISGHYLTRNGSGIPAHDWRTQDRTHWISDEERVKRSGRHERARELAYVDSFGGGFLAITQEAKQKVGHPWFKTLYQDSGDYLGEDTFFCQRLQEEGFKPAVDFGIPVGHAGQKVYMPGGN